MVSSRRRLAPALCAALVLAASFGPGLVDARRLLQSTTASPPPPSLFVDWNSIYRTTIAANADAASSILEAVGPIVASALGAADGITQGLGIGNAGVSASLSGANSITGYSLDGASNITQAITERNVVVNNATTPVIDRMINAAIETEREFAPPPPATTATTDSASTDSASTDSTTTGTATTDSVTTNTVSAAAVTSPSPAAVTATAASVTSPASAVTSTTTPSSVTQSITSSTSPVIITDVSGLGR